MNRITKVILSFVIACLSVVLMFGCKNNKFIDNNNEISQSNQSLNESQNSPDVWNGDNSDKNTDTSETTSKGESPVTDFQYEISQDGKSIYINKYIGTSENVLIPSYIDGLPVVSIKGVTDNEGIHKGAFEGCNIKNVVIPESVTAIGLYAFKGCEELINVTIPQNLSSLSAGAFQNCIKLEKIDLCSTKIQIIEDSAFEHCINLKEISLPGGLLKIQQRAFYDCSSLLKINLPENMKRIEKEAFVKCISLKTITVPTKIELLSLESVPFYNIPALEKIIFEDGREEITGYAFFDITSNVEIIIPKSVKKFSSASFLMHGSAKLVFLGNCPEIVEKSDFYGDPTIYYDPSTEGWEDCIWKNQYTLEPIKK